MPTLCLPSPPLKTTADGLSLAVGITHQLRLATDDHPILKLQKFPSPESLDILSSASVLLRLTGSFEREEICTETLRQSSLVAYLLEYLKFVGAIPHFGAYIASSHTSQHAAQLFISDISDPYVSADGTLECTCCSESFHILANHR